MKKRYVSLDVFRGLTVALMIIVNNPGSWSKVFPILSHAPWEGCTPCDLVFPFFLFCVGTSMAFALAGYGSLSPDAVKKILKRGILLYLVGLGLTAFPFYPSASRMDPELSFLENWLQWLGGLRLVGVLARIAMCYVLGSLLVLWLRKPVRLIAAFCVLALLHVGLLLVFAGPEGAFSLEGNFARRLDVAVFGENHIYRGYGVPFDPEGLLGVLTGTCTVLAGYMSGTMIRTSSARYAEEGRSEDSPSGVVARLFVLSMLFLLIGQILGIWVPVSKPLWSVSYVFHTGGWAMAVLAVTAFLIDVKGWEKPFFPFKAMGMNALAIFVLSGLMMKVIWRYTRWNYTEVFGVNEWMSLLFALLYMLLHMAVAVILYKRKIFIKL